MKPQFEPSRPRVLAAAVRAISPIALALALLALALALGALFAPHPADAKTIRVIAPTDLPKEVAAPESLAYSVDELPYRVAPGDQLTVDFGVTLDGKPIRAENLLVRPDGMITLNPVGDIRAAGLTTADLDSVLMQKYVNVYREPRITIDVTKLAGNFVHIFGEVRAPGSYEMMPNSTVLQAIARAGGANDKAAMNNIILMRRTGPNSLVARRIEANRAINQGLASYDPYLRRFDVIFVPKSAIASVNLWVEQHVTNLLSVPTGYIYGWEAFHMDRVFPKSVRIQP
jgi:polysaccharide export outer membrane protein